MRVKTIFVNDLHKITKPDSEQIAALKDLHDYIKTEKIEVRIYTDARFHAKAYIFESDRYRSGDAAIVGSSNFSRSGMGVDKSSNTELNSIHRNSPDTTILRNWFDQIWEEAKPFQKDLLKIIESSQPYIQFVVAGLLLWWFDT